MDEIIIPARPTFHSDQEDEWGQRILEIAEELEFCHRELENAEGDLILLARQLRDKGFHPRARLKRLARSDRRVAETPGYLIEELRTDLAAHGFDEELALFDQIIAGKGELLVDDGGPEITDLEDLLDPDFNFEPPKTFRVKLIELNDAALKELYPLADKYFALKKDGDEEYSEHELKLERRRERALGRLRNMPLPTMPIVTYVRR